MTALTHRREPSARAWHEFSQRAQPTDVSEMQEAMFLASKLGIDYSEAVEHIRAKYAAEQGPCEVMNYAHRRGE